MNPVYTFSKRIKDEVAVPGQDIADPADIAKIDQVIQRLEALPRVTSSNLQEIGLRTNPKKWVASLIESYPDNLNRTHMEYLLSDFTDTMKTRMREESKYAIGLLMENKLVLSHSTYGEETITPEWKIIPRMLDSDNVLRYASFTNEKGVIVVRYWEREATSSFIEWLGLSRKQAFLIGGEYRIYCEIDGISTELQLTEQEMERWMKEHDELKEGKIRFSNPVQILNVIEIRTGRKRYQNAEDFLQDYEAERYGIPRYQKDFETIKSESLPLLMKYFDEKTQVVRKEGDAETTVVTKSTPAFDVIFADESIEIRASYLTDIAKRVINGETVSICHAGMKFRTPPFVLGSMRIYNNLNLDAATQRISAYYNEINLQDRNLDLLLKSVCIRMLGKENSKLAIGSVMESLSQEIMKELDLNGKLSKLEDTTIEYKSQDYLAGANDQVVQRISQDLRNKLKKSPCKFYIFGVEDNGTPNSIPASRLKSDRIEDIKHGLEDDLQFVKIYAIPIIQHEEGLLILMALHI